MRIVVARSIPFTPRATMNVAPRIESTCGSTGAYDGDLKWDFDTSDEKTTLTITSDQTPQKVQVWLVTAPTKDFRESKWVSQEVPASDGKYVYDLAVPSVGYAAVIGEAVYKADGPPFYLSTNVRIVGGPQADEAAGK